VLTNAIAAGALTLAATWGAPAGAPLEDEAGFDCATQGNHICGPGDKSPAGAGLYRDGQLIQPWTNYEDIEADPLNGVTPGTEYDLAAQVAALHTEDYAAPAQVEGCWIEYKDDQTTELIYGDLALLPADATEVPCGQVDEALEYGQEPPAGAEDYYGGTPGGAVCSTDAACSAYTRDHGGEYGYGASPEKAALWDGIPA
jgi:hypothetical protein